MALHLVCLAQYCQYYQAADALKTQCFCRVALDVSLIRDLDLAEPHAEIFVTTSKLEIALLRLAGEKTGQIFQILQQGHSVL